jgi:hypothetical protein
MLPAAEGDSIGSVAADDGLLNLNGQVAEEAATGELKVKVEPGASDCL